MKTIFLDFKTFYDTHVKCSRCYVSIAKFLKHDKSCIQGFAMKLGDSPTIWIEPDKVGNLLDEGE